tara:strand:+ start:864 stop:1007 length:144 start_codon:yes stop_codon:yes gene_type:complete
LQEEAQAKLERLKTAVVVLSTKQEGEGEMQKGGLQSGEDCMPSLQRK